VLEGQVARLSGPALETLAIIAYKQPVSRAQLSAIRGVNVDATLKTLVARGYVEEIGHDHAPGNPVLFGTTRVFLERLGLDSLDELPAIADCVPDASIVETLERGLRLTPADAGAEVVAIDRRSGEAASTSTSPPAPGGSRARRASGSKGARAGFGCVAMRRGSGGRIAAAAHAQTRIDMRRPSRATTFPSSSASRALVVEQTGGLRERRAITRATECSISYRKAANRSVASTWTARAALADERRHSHSS
jgi:hypothetical protein